MQSESTEIHAQRRPVAELLQSLHQKFSGNLQDISPTIIALLEEFDLQSRAIDGLASELVKHCEQDTQKLECSRILNEVFADFSVAMYLLTVGLVVPARMLVRRAFELGLGAVYMWDMPHKYWGWAKHDNDLSFTEIIDHFSSDGYASHLANIRGCATVFPYKPGELQKIYRNLSNTVHGKLDDLPPLSPERYSLAKNNAEESIKISLRVQMILISIWATRFPGLKTYLERDFPQVARN